MLAVTGIDEASITQESSNNQICHKSNKNDTDNIEGPINVMRDQK